MRNFRFRLQAVLTLREQAEQRAQQRYGRAVATVNRAVDAVNAAEAELAAADARRQARLAAGLCAAEFVQLRNYRRCLEEQHGRLSRDLAQARERAEQARLQLVAATQRRETLERLRERQRHTHEYEAVRLEQKLLDEISSRSQVLAEIWSEPAATNQTD